MLPIRPRDGFPMFVGRREMGLGHRSPGLSDLVYKQLYSSFDQGSNDDDKYFVYSDYSGSNSCPTVGPTGAIFNLAFSPDG